MLKELYPLELYKRSRKTHEDDSQRAKLILEASSYDPVIFLGKLTNSTLGQLLHGGTKAKQRRARLCDATVELTADDYDLYGVFHSTSRTGRGKNPYSLHSNFCLELNRNSWIDTLLEDFSVVQKLARERSGTAAYDAERERVLRKVELQLEELRPVDQAYRSLGGWDVRDYHRLLVDHLVRSWQRFRILPEEKPAFFRDQVILPLTEAFHSCYGPGTELERLSGYLSRAQSVIESDWYEAPESERRHSVISRLTEARERVEKRRDLLFIWDEELPVGMSLP